MQTLNQILGKVQKPGRYIGEETNSVRKEHTAGRTSVALAYPDTYEVGMSYLGLRILYHLLNERDDIVCERVFAPWEDMEKELVKAGRRLFGLESKTALDEFDILGFSLSYELTYTNVLNMLHLSGITLRSRERREEEPLVIAGGACCYNPEPMSGFIDAFLIGDGEELFLRFIDEYKKLKRTSLSRKDILKALSALPGVYVPSLYRAEYENGSFSRLDPLEENIPRIIEKVNVADLDAAYYPVKQIMPLVKIIHDRVAVEVMRGCPNRCRFCQAGTTGRPVRLRKPERVMDICRRAYENTGCERIALLSLSSVNYPYLLKVVKGLNEDFKDKGVGLSIPSLRVDEAFYDLPEMISAIRKAGLTFAPESASDGIRRSIGKDIDLGILCKSVSLAYEHGWRNLKLYFMIGFPGEPEDEPDRIISLARELSGLKRNISGGAAEVRVSVNAFVPKAHTPFQWLGMPEKERFLSVKNKLRAGNSKRIKIEVSDIDRSFLEACISRGDRRIGDVIYAAWKKGARMDGWTEFFNFSVWLEAFREKGLDLYSYAGRTHEVSDALPWGHIKIGTSVEDLKRELMESGF